MTDYFNEIDPFCCAWLANLYPASRIDARSIREVQPADLAGLRRAHFFGGVGGWQHALDLAGWGDAPVWTGSCPCQPFSDAGKKKGVEDERHLWPEFFRLIRQCQPAIVLGEQVASKDGLGWLDGVFADLEGAGYACGAADLCAAGAGAPHIRQRLFWVGIRGGVSDCGFESSRQLPSGQSPCPRLGQGLAEAECEPRRHCEAGGLCDAGASRVRAEGRGADAGAESGDSGEGDQRQRLWADAGDACSSGGLSDLDSAGRGERGGTISGAASDAAPEQCSPWSDFFILPYRDGKYRRIGTQPGDVPLAHGIPSRGSDPRLGQLVAALVGMGRSAKSARRLVRDARSNRVGRLRGYGNAIVPVVAAEFIRAVMEYLEANP